MVGSLLAVGGLAVAGCSVTGGPTVDPLPATSRPTPTPTPTPTLTGLAEGLAAEVTAAAMCHAVAERRYELPGAAIANLTTLATVHDRHVEVLSGPTPTRRPAPGSATPTTTPAPPTITLDPDQAKAVASVQASLRDATATHRAAAVMASGLDALLWGSLAAAASQDAVLVGRTTPIPAPVAEPAHEVPDIPPDTEGASILMRQLHAAVYGYQVAMEELRGEQSEPYAQRLGRLRTQRDGLARLLRTRGIAPPAAEPGYDLAPVDSAAAALALVSELERALLPHQGRWLAAAGPAGIGPAVDGVIDGATMAVIAGGTPLIWPGWPT
ncbi:DUF4439 domain-containing protein [Microlunatus sp. Y2014]|uniref:DUF4439 domain-containing protein n=1 Tax=Microlunatus sp. Y2014 TaxID=3418488 RepID=UPI003DA70C84